MAYNVIKNVKSPERPINKENSWNGTPIENRLFFLSKDNFSGDFMDYGHSHIVSLYMIG